MDPSDIRVMPIGRFAGKPWTQLTDGLLKQVMALDPEKYPAVTQDHKDAAEAELLNRPEEGEVQS